MKKCAIITISNSNYGNRLQNYALQYFLQSNNYYVETIKNVNFLNKRKNKFNYFLRRIAYLFKKSDFKDGWKREKNFKRFNKRIKFSKKVFSWNNYSWMKEYDYFIVGSDQVWNPQFRLTEFDLCAFSEKKKIISFAASIGVTKLDDNDIYKIKKYLTGIKAISVRENEGAKLLEQILPNQNIVTLLDPTLLLNDIEWESIETKPNFVIPKKFILCYFLGGMNENTINFVNNYARIHKLQIINLLDKKSLYYECGPSEFLYLERNADIIFTDSFHSIVFSIIFKKNFIVFDRIEKQHDCMNSRISTILKKFNLEDRVYCSNFDPYKIDNIDYKNLNVEGIVKDEKEKSLLFIINNTK